jgi:hypothetical protein
VLKKGNTMCGHRPLYPPIHSLVLHSLVVRPKVLKPAQNQASLRNYLPKLPPSKHTSQLISNPFPKQTHHPTIIQSILTSHSHRRLSYPIVSASALPTPQSSIVLSQSYSTTGARHHHCTTPLVLVSIATGIATRASSWSIIIQPLGHLSHSGIVRATRASPLGQGQSHSGISTSLSTTAVIRGRCHRRPVGRQRHQRSNAIDSRHQRSIVT